MSAHVMSPQTMRRVTGCRNSLFSVVIPGLGIKAEYSEYVSNVIQCGPGWSVHSRNTDTGPGNRWAGANTVKWVFIFATFPIQTRVFGSFSGLILAQ